jgi:uncharacterized protein YndB with AHSA1/START domain
MTKQTIKLERSYDASLADVWELWTTKEGIEAWWGPVGFSVNVLEIDVRPSGKLWYAMTATAAPQVEFMKKAGMPLTTKTSITFKEVTPRTRLVLAGIADFIPGVAPYETLIDVDFVQADNGVRILITLEPMHDEVWTGRMAAGWESQLERLQSLLAQRVKGT